MHSIDLRIHQPLRPSMIFRNTQPTSSGRASRPATTSLHQCKSTNRTPLAGCQSAFIWNIMPVRREITRCRPSLASEGPSDDNRPQSEASHPRSEPPTSSGLTFAQSASLKQALRVFGAMAAVLLTGLATIARPAFATVDSAPKAAAVVDDRPLSTRSDDGKASTSGRQATDLR